MLSLPIESGIPVSWCVCVCVCVFLVTDAADERVLFINIAAESRGCHLHKLCTSTCDRGQDLSQGSRTKKQCWSTVKHRLPLYAHALAG